MALGRAQVIEFIGTALHNFLPQSLTWEISSMNLMVAWKAVDLHELQTTITDYGCNASSQDGHDLRLSPIQLYLQSNEVAILLLACDHQRVTTNERKIQQLPLDKEWMTNSANLEQQLGTTSWVGSPDSIKAAFGRVGTVKGQHMQSLGTKKEEEAAEEGMAPDLDSLMK